MAQSIRSAVVVGAVCVLVFALNGCFSPLDPTPTPVSNSKLEVLDSQLQPYDNMFMPWVIIGHAKNVSGRTLSYAEVHGQFYDASDVLIADWLDNINDLASGVVWEFRIYCMDSAVADRVHHATVTIGSCF